MGSSLQLLLSQLRGCLANREKITQGFLKQLLPSSLLKIFQQPSSQISPPCLVTKVSLVVVLGRLEVEEQKMLGTKADLHSDLPDSRRASNRRIQLHALHSASLIHLLAPSSISLSLWRPLIISPALFLQMFPPLQGEHLPWTSRRWPGRSWRTPPWVRPLPQVPE